MQGRVSSAAELAAFAVDVGGTQLRYYVWADNDWRPVCKYMGDTARCWDVPQSRAMLTMQCSLVYSQASTTKKTWELAGEQIRQLANYSGKTP